MGLQSQTQLSEQEQDCFLPAPPKFGSVSVPVAHTAGRAVCLQWWSPSGQVLPGGSGQLIHQPSRADATASDTMQPLLPGARAQKGFGLH